MARSQVYTASQLLQTLEQSTGLELVHFSSPLFTACASLSRQLERLAGSVGAFVEIVEVELAMQNAELIRSFQLERLPTLLLFVDGQEVERLEEHLSPADLESFVRDAISFYAGREN